MLLSLGLSKQLHQLHTQFSPVSVDMRNRQMVNSAVQTAPEQPSNTLNKSTMATKTALKVRFTGLVNVSETDG